VKFRNRLLGNLAKLNRKRGKFRERKKSGSEISRNFTKIFFHEISLQKFSFRINFVFREIKKFTFVSTLNPRLATTGAFIPHWKFLYDTTISYVLFFVLFFFPGPTSWQLKRVRECLGHGWGSRMNPITYVCSVRQFSIQKKNICNI
jgi:hypothetical protein